MTSAHPMKTKNKFRGSDEAERSSAKGRSARQRILAEDRGDPPILRRLLGWEPGHYAADASVTTTP
jgi:hypothetical protein